MTKSIELYGAHVDVEYHVEKSETDYFNGTGYKGGIVVDKITHNGKDITEFVKASWLFHIVEEEFIEFEELLTKI